MSDLKIILFLCNWGPHAAYLALQDQLADIPVEIKMVRIPCSGRISKALLFKSFEMGADGVVLMGCKSGSCRYGTGTASAQENSEDTRRILDLTGLNRGRLRLGNFLPDETEKMLHFLQEFAGQVRRLGPSPVVRRTAAFPAELPDDSPAAIMAVHDVYACQDCGKCTSACPLALAGKNFSPRFIVGEVIAGRADSPAVRDAVHACLTCGVCYERCPSAVNFPEFIQRMRVYYHSREVAASPVHGGFFQSLMRAMTSDKLEPRRWNQLPEGIRTCPDSDVLYFGGCAPYFDVFFRKFLNVHTERILEDSLRLLNFFDIEPRLLEGERCCGHDLLWAGDTVNFQRLARLNAQAIADSGVSEVITSCPECYHTLSREYPRHGVELPVKVTHMHALLEKEIGKGAVAFKPLEAQLVFQDACRQSRLCAEPDLPRRLIRRMTGTEMLAPALQTPSVCCGNSAWIGCDAYSKAMQVQRLTQARGSGGELMLTACPKCQIHLRCAMEDATRGEELKMELMDLTSAIARTIYWK